MRANVCRRSGRISVSDLGAPATMHVVYGSDGAICHPGVCTAMMTTFRNSANCVQSNSSTELPLDVIWIDLLNPTAEEISFVESRTSARIPSINALSEIESSSRLAVHHEILYLSIPVVAAGDTVDAYLTPLALF